MRKKKENAKAPEPDAKIAQLVRRALEGFMENRKGFHRQIHRFGDNLQIINQRPDTTSEYGKKKYFHHLETVWLSLYNPNTKATTELARLSEQKGAEPEFVLLKLEHHLPLVSKYQEQLAELAIPK